MWQRALGVKLLCFMVLLIFGIIPDQGLNTPKCISVNFTNPTDQDKMCTEYKNKHNNQGVSNACTRQEKNYIDQIIEDFKESIKTCKNENFIMTVFKVDMNTKNRLVKLPAPEVSDDDMPIDVLVPIEPFLKMPKEQHKVAVVKYNSAQQFINNSSTVIRSKVIRVEIVGCECKNFSNLLVINFTMNGSEIIPKNHRLSCQFFDETELRWDDMGSFTNLENFNSSNIVTCSYNHMTPFAVLLVDMNVAQIDPQQWKILSYITYIGCSLSLFFSAVTIFLYAFMKRSNRDNSIHIHVSLSTAVFLLNTSFLFTEWGATWSQESLCVLIAVIIQYSLLACFSWMAIEAIHLYLLLIKVFNTYIKHYMIKLSLFGWGVPAVLVGGSLCVYDITPFYGTTAIKLLSTNETTRFCWITDAHFLYGMNLTYFSITFLFNTSILVSVTSQIFKLRRLNVRGNKLPTRKDTCTVLGLTLLLGMTWGLAFFSSGYTNYPVLYLFCICNTLQGLFLFLWFIGTTKRNKRLKTQPSTLSEAAISTLNTRESSFTQ